MQRTTVSHAPKSFECLHQIVSISSKQRIKSIPTIGLDCARAANSTCFPPSFRHWLLIRHIHHDSLIHFSLVQSTSLIWLPIQIVQIVGNCFDRRLHVSPVRQFVVVANRVESSGHEMKTFCGLLWSTRAFWPDRPGLPIRSLPSLFTAANQVRKSIMTIKLSIRTN